MKHIFEGVKRVFLSITNPDNSGLRVVILCVFGATIFWFLNAMNETYTTTIDYPLRYSFDDDKYVPVDFPPREIDINVTGNGWNLLRYSLGFNLVPVEVDLDNLPENTSFPARDLKPLITERLKELKVNYVAKDSVNFHFDLWGRKVIRVKVDSANIPLASGYRIISPVKVAPSQIIIRGPVSGLDTLDEVITLPVPEKRIDASYNEKLNIDILNDSLYGFSNRKIRVRFNVASYLTRSVKVPVNVLNTDSTRKSDSLILNPSRVNVKFLWPEKQSPVPGKEDFNLIADYDTRNPEDSSVVPELREKPDQAREIVIKPLKVKLYYDEQQKQP